MQLRILLWWPILQIPLVQGYLWISQVSTLLHSEPDLPELLQSAGMHLDGLRLGPPLPLEVKASRPACSPRALPCQHFLLSPVVPLHYPRLQEKLSSTARLSPVAHSLSRRHLLYRRGFGRGTPR